MDQRQRERGAIVVLTAILMPVLLAFGGLAIDWGRMLMDRVQLQATADSAALAGDSILPGDPNQARQVAGDFVGRNPVFGRPPEYDVLVGTWDPETRSFIPNPGPSADTVMVSAWIEEKMFFGAFLGRDTAKVLATATATRTPGDQNISLVLDNSGSMAGAMNDLIEASLRFTDMLEQAYGKHTLGLVTYSHMAWLKSPLTSDFTTIRDELRQMGPIMSTNIGWGMRLGREDVFFQGQPIPNATDVVILLSDGGANTPGGVSDACASGNPDLEALCEALAFRYAKGGNPDVPAEQDKNKFLFTISLGSDADPALMEKMASQDRCRARPETGGDTNCHYLAPDTGSLDAIFEEILRNGPMRLVD